MNKTSRQFTWQLNCQELNYTHSQGGCEAGLQGKSKTLQLIIASSSFVLRVTSSILALWEI